MKIIILGAGQVGCSVAMSLSREDNDITVIDTDENQLRNLQERVDLQTVMGHASHPQVLKRAGARDADMVLAVTNSDEVNMLACQVAYTLFNTPTRIARIRSVDYLRHESLFKGAAVPVDVVISPEQLVTHHIKRLIEYPGALQVVDFGRGRVQLVAAKAEPGAPLVGHAISDLHEHMPGEVRVRVAAIFRRQEAIIPDGNTVIEPDDEVFFLAARRDIATVLAELQQSARPARRIILAGGGNIGRNLAHALEKNHYVKVIEHNESQARLVAEGLDRAIVLKGDCADQNLLREENIDQTDVYCGLTNDDEANILSSMLAKRMGARKVLTLINRPSYVDLVESGTIDIAISPQQITISALLTHIRRGHVEQVHTLRRGAAEAMEAVAHGDRHSSRVVGRRIDELDLPNDVTIGGIVRGDALVVAHHDTIIEAEDHVILLLTDRRRVAEVEQLFQVGIMFI
jgi:trk system potassium uptake protein TrkA